MTIVAGPNIGEVLVAKSNTTEILNGIGFADSISGAGFIASDILRRTRYADGATAVMIEDSEVQLSPGGNTYIVTFTWYENRHD